MLGSPSRLTPLRASHGCGIDGFAKMFVQAHIFAAWYNTAIPSLFRPFPVLHIGSGQSDPVQSNGEF